MIIPIVHPCSRLYLSLGRVIFYHQEFNKAADAFHEFKNDPQLRATDGELFTFLGQIDIQEKKYDEALRNCRPLILQETINGLFFNPLISMKAQAYLGKADAATALTYYFEKAAQVTGASGVTHLCLKRDRADQG